MTKELEGILSEWKFCRNNTIEFIKSFSDAILDMKLPRSGLDTFRKHFVEMANVQEAYIRGIETTQMSFGETSESIAEDCPVTSILQHMQQLDDRMLEALNQIDDNRQINWFGEKKTLYGHVCALCTHEILHIGQIIAFCYTLDVPIPNSVAQDWDLPV